MQGFDIIPTPAACRHIARLFRARQTHAEGMIARASRALDVLECLDDRAIGLWDRALLSAAFEVVGAGARSRAHHMREGFDALGLDAAAEDREEGSGDAA